MNSGNWVKLVLIIIGAIVAVNLLKWLLSLTMHLLQLGVTVAIIVGIVWLVMTILGKKKAY